ncbi:ABC transporter ATP-binding protein [Nitratireductor aquibiodomus]|uniref:ABC transporter ATP-binding protein n=1 Tax=Nitratireductor aquibiodomus TaxID=204799 RepID=UPI0019D34BE4|nr:ABC transporter ATP-binding protein [Nitratireductor aquibiodomus]MBN7760712.1 ABC transporter ATP-binding protein [Nitratireductor aquibiodomus]
MGKSITIDKVSKSYSGLEALVPTSIDIKPGEFLSIVGPSGCGKSTLLRIIAGLNSPTTGKLLVGGEKVTKAETDLGFVFQSPVLLEWRSVIDNIMLQAEARGLPDAEYRAKARDLLAASGLAGFENAYPHQLSGGMSQRVSVCRALVHDPSLLLMDEPFGALDALTRDQMMVDLQSLWLRSQPTVVFVTHSIQEAVFLSDRIVVMAPRPGRVEAVLDVPLPRRRRLSVRSTPEFNGIVDQILIFFERMGVIRDDVQDAA